MNGGDFMASINVSIQISVTLSALNGTSLDAILTWLNTNITKQLPSNASAVIIFTNMIP